MYNGQNLCFHFGMAADGLKDQCINPEGFASFLGLLESIPLHNSDSNHGSFEHAMPDARYIVSYFGIQLMSLDFVLWFKIKGCDYFVSKNLKRVLPLIDI